MHATFEEKLEAFKDSLRIQNRNVRECMSELLGTFILTFFSITSVANYVLSHGTASSLTSAALADGMGVTMAVYSCAEVSGGFINPAVSLAMCMTGRLPWRRWPVHVIGQMIGAFLAACVANAAFSEALDKFDGGHRQVLGPNGTASAFCYFPPDHVTLTSGIINSMISTGLLVLVVHGILDKNNLSPPPGLVPIPVGFLIFLLVSALGYVGGVVINPARDLGPRVFLLVAGWGKEVFSYRDYQWFWVPIVAPCMGAIVFTTIYWALIAHHWPKETEEEGKERHVKDVVDIWTKL